MMLISHLCRRGSNLVLATSVVLMGMCACSPQSIGSDEPIKVSHGSDDTAALEYSTRHSLTDDSNVRDVFVVGYKQHNTYYLAELILVDSKQSVHYVLAEVLPAYDVKRAHLAIESFLRDHYTNRNAKFIITNSDARRIEGDLIFGGERLADLLVREKLIKKKSIKRQRKYDDVDTHLPITPSPHNIVEFKAPNLVLLEVERSKYRSHVNLLDFVVFDKHFDETMYFLNEEYVGKTATFYGTKDDEGRLIGCLKIDGKMVSSHLQDKGYVSKISDSRLPYCTQK